MFFIYTLNSTRPDFFNEKITIFVQTCVDLVCKFILEKHGILIVLMYRLVHSLNNELIIFAR